MAGLPRVVITGTGAVCGAGRTPDEILDAVQAGRSAVAPIRQWDTAGWPVRMAAEIADYNPTALVEDRKLHKLIRRTDLLGLYAAGRAIAASGLAAYRDGLAPEEAAAVSDRIGVYVGSGGGAYQNQYDYFPLLTAAGEDLQAFGRELGANVNPMWLLRTLPNNVLCHVGIRYGLKGANACVTNHVVGGALAVVEAAAGLRAGEADRAVAIGHDAPIEPQMVLYYHSVGLFATEAVRPFDAARDGSLFGEGAGTLVLETADAAASRGAPILGEVLGAGSVTEGEGLFTLREDGDGLARAIEAALADAGIRPAGIGMISAHGNGTRQSDATEAAAIRRVFGSAPPPVTAFKWAFGHLIAASGPVETVLTLLALHRRVVPGIATLRRLDPACAGLPVSAKPQTPRSDVGLVLSRGFGGTNVALVVRAASGPAGG
jgi:3-oxoacyl-[acyl-carrier-protein] synthase-1